MSARDAILSGIRARKAGHGAARPEPYRPPPPADGLAETFIAHAEAANAVVRVLDRIEDVPQAVAELLRGRNLKAAIHRPREDRYAEWLRAQGLLVQRAPPGPDDATLATAPLAIAETGTLVYPAAEDAPASWHFRPGFEIAVLHAGDIVPNLEAALARLNGKGALAPTINLVTGPSRTADIEQTLELGAHGPKALAILLVRGAP